MDCIPDVGVVQRGRPKLADGEGPEGVLPEPVNLSRGFGYGEATGDADVGDGSFSRGAEVHQEGGGDDAGTADALAAVDGDAFARLELLGEFPE